MVTLTKQDVVYLSGPMTGFVDYNKPAFFEVEKMLVRRVKAVLNPARNPVGLSWEENLIIDLKAITKVTALVLLPGWQYSKGANREVKRAKELGLKILTL